MGQGFACNRADFVIIRPDRVFIGKTTFGGTGVTTAGAMLGTSGGSSAGGVFCC